ncbi:MAG: VOC family protein [Gemmataceae bacterium]|nr:VOC family protein [Gemmataceae bacterium]
MTGGVDGLAVVLVLTRDTGRAAAFYRDVLGLTLSAEAHDGKHTHYACRLGSVYFTIQAAADLAAPDPGPGYDALQLCSWTPSSAGSRASGSPRSTRPGPTRRPGSSPCSTRTAGTSG